jgi:hypothetical protein
MSQANDRRRTVRALVTAACLACIGFAIADMLRSLRKYS